MIKETIELLGKKMRDKITGREGTISSVCFDLYGCVQACITPPQDKDGKLLDNHWMDVQRLEMVDGSCVMPIPDFDRKAATPSQYTAGAAEKPSFNK